MKKIIIIIIVLLLICSSLISWDESWESLWYKVKKIDFIQNSHIFFMFSFSTARYFGIQIVRGCSNHRTGFFLHAQYHGGPNRDYVYDSITPYIAEEIYHDWYKGDAKTGKLYAGGVTFGLSHNTLLCLGLGLGQQVKYRNYIDGTGILGDGGSYYIIEKEDWGFSPYVALNFKIARFWVGAFSVSTYPFQVGFGIGGAFGMMGIK